MPSPCADRADWYGAQVHVEKLYVVVQVGITLTDLHTALAAHGLAMRNLGSNAAPSRTRRSAASSRPRATARGSGVAGNSSVRSLREHATPPASSTVSTVTSPT